MIWLIRMGLGVSGTPEALTAISWDELVLTPETDPAYARRAMDGLVNLMVDFAVKHLGHLDPADLASQRLLEHGPKEPLRAAFTGFTRIRQPFVLEVRSQPAECDAKTVADAIVAARAATAEAVRYLRIAWNGDAMLLASHEHKHPVPRIR